jgi:hypothetical protein
MPMWPPVFTTVAAHDANPTGGTPAATPLRRRWMIVEGSARHDVSEAEYRQALEACHRIEIAHFERNDVITYVCYLGAGA